MIQSSLNSVARHPLIAMGGLWIRPIIGDVPPVFSPNLGDKYVKRKPTWAVLLHVSLSVWTCLGKLICIKRATTGQSAWLNTRNLLRAQKKSVKHLPFLTCVQARKKMIPIY